ncbi:hypothetical protein SAMN06269185_2922 [Natronoarchaeum philippinense]|uniref:Uncharacterized protein n=1 Tax=Natronoarchaeum philippinense TaxID=558529 RepID=A0A285P610_NATPI|nr:hypothetical protein [Natronoarchaeum philippinense]SNZ17199.1 hypothetical protein SAMN06269185_2922 [Natronoarchaeum philippinense]
MVTKRSIGASLLLLGLAFVGIFHTIAALAFDSGLFYIGVVIAALSLLGIVLVNIPPDESSGDADESGGDDADEVAANGRGSDRE